MWHDDSDDPTLYVKSQMQKRRKKWNAETDNMYYVYGYPSRTSQLQIKYIEQLEQYKINRSKNKTMNWYGGIARIYRVKW